MSRRATTLVAKDLAEGRLVRPFGDDLEYDFAYYIFTGRMWLRSPES